MGRGAEWGHKDGWRNVGKDAGKGRETEKTKGGGERASDINSRLLQS